MAYLLFNCIVIVVILLVRMRFFVFFVFNPDGMCTLHCQHNRPFRHLSSPTVNQINAFFVVPKNVMDIGIVIQMLWILVFMCDSIFFHPLQC